MSTLQKIWIAEFIFGEKGTLQSLLVHERGGMEVKFFDNGGNFHHILITDYGSIQPID